MRRHTTSNDVVEVRFQSRLHALHLARIKSARICIDDNEPPKFAHLNPALKPVPHYVQERQRLIKKENGLLVDRMVSILARKPPANHDTTLLTRAAHATVEDASRPSLIPLPKSLTKDARTKQLESIVLENERFLSRLLLAPGVYTRKEWKKQYEIDLRHMQQLRKFPGDNSMPQIHPILAIAQAQSDKTAEWILKQQQKQYGMQQLNSHDPHFAAAAAAATSSSLPHLPSSSCSTQTSEMSALPSYPISSFNPSIPNHFPMPPQHPPTIQQPQPPPITARSKSASSRKPQVKLRAQYTSQGVRIIKTTCHTSRSSKRGGSAGSNSNAAGGSQEERDSSNTAMQRPSTTIETVRDAAAASELRASKFVQPLRNQQNAQLASSRPATSASAALGSKKKSGREHQEEHKEATPQFDSPSHHPTSTTASPPPPGTNIALFSDTLVISTRVVLVRIFECSTPWRFEIRVFDPQTELEYALTLPYSYIKMCFYAVPDLLKQENRIYLVQTLLHYLAFVSSPQTGALELLVDIVAPKPRTREEEYAWRQVNEEIAEERREEEGREQEMQSPNTQQQPSVQQEQKKEDVERKEESVTENQSNTDTTSSVAPAASSPSEETFLITQGNGSGSAAPATNEPTEPSNVAPPPDEKAES